MNAPGRMNTQAAERKLTRRFANLLAESMPDIIAQVLRAYEREQAAAKLAKADVPKFTLLVDFDGTINDQRGHHSDPTKIDALPVPGVLQAVADAQRAGYPIAIFTGRLNPFSPWVVKAIRDWLIKYNFPGDIDAVRFTASKQLRALIIDNQCFRFEGTFPSLGEIRELSVSWNEKFPQPLRKEPELTK